MAKLKSPLPVSPTRNPEKSVEILKRQLERLAETIQLRFDDPKVKAWEVATVNALHEAFGKPNGQFHSNTTEFKTGVEGPMYIGMTDSQLQNHFLAQQAARKELLSAFIEQLEDAIGVERGVGSVVPVPADEVETLFGRYKIGIRIGEGGAGSVHRATDEDGKAVAIKFLDRSKSNTEKQKRFRNELRFCLHANHKHVVHVLDYGVKTDGTPFYIMGLFDSSLRQAMQTISPAQAYSIFKRILEGLDAAHKLGVTHRDLKPENILLNKNDESLVIADFGIANFEQEELYSEVETKVGARLGSFQYAAPEQRARGKQTDKRTDIFALGLILNELFTKELAVGLNFKLISTVAPEFGYLDEVVTKMLDQEPSNRYQDTDAIKQDLNLKGQEFIARQKISHLTGHVVEERKVEDILISDPIRVVDGDWDENILTIELNRAPNQAWIWALNNMGSHTSVYGFGPEVFSFKGKHAVVRVGERDAQRVVDYFKQWLPLVHRRYQAKLENDLRVEEEREREEIRKQKLKEETKIRVKKSLKF